MRKSRELLRLVLSLRLPYHAVERSLGVSHGLVCRTLKKVREPILELRTRGHTVRQIASILNEQGWMPLKGRCFTERSVNGRLHSIDAAKILSPC